MPVEMIVDPAGMGAVWRPPEGSAPHCAYNAADHGTHTSGDHQAGPRTGGRADGIRCSLNRFIGDVAAEDAACRIRSSRRRPGMAKPKIGPG